MVRGWQKVKRELTFNIEESLYPFIQASTDSELLIYLALTYGLEDTPLGAIERMVDKVEETCRKTDVDNAIQKTICTTDGNSLFAARYATKGVSDQRFTPSHPSKYTRRLSLSGRYEQMQCSKIYARYTFLGG